MQMNPHELGRDCHAVLPLPANGNSRASARKPTTSPPPSYDWFTEGFGTTDLKEAKALLAELK